MPKMAFSMPSRADRSGARGRKSPKHKDRDHGQDAGPEAADPKTTLNFGQHRRETCQGRPQIESRDQQAQAGEPRKAQDGRFPLVRNGSFLLHVAYSAGRAAAFPARRRAGIQIGVCKRECALAMSG